MRGKVQSTIELRQDQTVAVGALVRYYLEGWRCGYIESAAKGNAKIRPVVSRFATGIPRLINVPLTDVEPLKGVRQ